MKKYLLALLSALLLSCLLSSAALANGLPGGYTSVAETDSLVLYLNETTAEICVHHKAYDQYWFSNPPEADSDPLASGINLSRVKSQIELVYSSIAGQTLEYNSYDFSTRDGKFTFDNIDGGVKVTYNFSDDVRDINYLPKQISIERLETLVLNKLEKADQDRVKSIYLLTRAEGVYKRTDRAQTTLALARLFSIFDKVGYTDEEMDYDKAQYESDGAINNKPKINNVSLSYVIKGDEFFVTFHAGEVDEPEGFFIQSYKILGYFGAAGTDKEGYIFVPDGSGALINLNSGKTALQSYRATVYGRDPSINVIEQITKDEPIRLPVFGMKQNDDGFFAVIEKGSAIASIEADISGRTSSYNSVGTSYVVRARDTLSMTDGSSVKVALIYQKERYADDVTIRYGFLKGDDSTYAGMARHYQDYLIRKHNLTPVTNENMPFYLETVAGIEKKSSFLGIPYTKFVAMTTFEETEEIVNELLAQNVANMQVRVTGWFNKGVRHTLPTSIKVMSALGGKRGLNHLSNFLSDIGAGFFPEVNLLINYRTTFFYNESNMAARTINQKPAFGSVISIPTYMENKNFERYSIIAPKQVSGIVDKFLSKYNPFNLSGISLGDMGGTIQSDYFERDIYTREDTLNIIDEQMAKFADYEVMTNSGNAVSIGHSDHILNIPATSSGYAFTDTSIPFMQMVLHGYVDFASEPFNLMDAKNSRAKILNLLETGSGVYFKLTYERSDITMRTEYDYLYSTYYADWMSTAVEAYSIVNENLKDVRTARISEHSYLKEGVAYVLYDNGISFTINYNSYPETINGVTIPAEGFVREAK